MATDISKLSDDKIQTMLLDELYSTPELRRKELIERVINTMGFTREEQCCTAPDSLIIAAKGRVGMILSACQKSGYITEDEIGRLKVVGTGKRFISREKLRDFVVNLLQEKGTVSKGDIYAETERSFGTDTTPSEKDSNDLRAAMGKVLQRLEAEQHIMRSERGYSLVADNYPNTEMGSVLREAASGGELKDCFLRAIHIRGGEWFERYAVELLTAYYRSCGKDVLSAAVTGGSDDGGIDGIIKTEDWLGYREVILMQMKNRHAVMSSKDVREFYGAVCAERGSRGVFITISDFHREAVKLMDKVDNLIGINGDKLFDIACLCNKGIMEKDGKKALDEKMFLE